jgi:hypothetical protein
VGVGPGLYDDPHRRSLTSGGHSSVPPRSSDPYPVVPLTNLTVVLKPHDWCLRTQGRSDRHPLTVPPIGHGLPHVRSDPLDG